MLDDQNEIWGIITKSFTEALNPQEQSTLDNWLTSDAINQKSYNTFRELSFSLKSSRPEQFKSEVFNEVFARIRDKKANQVRVYVLSTVAAAVLVIIATAFLFYRFGEKSINTQLVEVFAPNGIKSKIKLPDGSVVVLNSNSRIVYPNRFYGNNREIKFEGEGFFSIAKDKEHPFIVNTPALKVQVLGTRFNLKAYDNDPTIETTLEEGSVRILPARGNANQVKLVPGNLAVFDRRSNNINIVNVDPQKYSSWQQNKFYFKSKPFEEIARILERRFDITIEIKNEKLKHEIFSGDFVRGENLDQILTIINKNTDISFSKHGQKIIITSR